MTERPTRRQVLLAASVSLAVVVGAVVASVLAVGSVTPPTYAADAPVVSSLLVTQSDLPGWHAAGHDIFQRSQVVANSGLVPDATEMTADRGCAFLAGPTDARAVTALAADAFGSGSEQIFSEAVAYTSAAPVEADTAAARQPGYQACLARVLSEQARSQSASSSVLLHPVRLKVQLGDVSALAVSGTWSTYYPEPGGPRLGGTHIELVLLAGSRAEVVIVAENDDGLIEQSLVNRVVARSAAALESHLD